MHHFLKGLVDMAHQPSGSTQKTCLGGARDISYVSYNVISEDMDKVVSASVIKWLNEARPLITTKKIYLNSRPKPMFCNQDLGVLLAHF
ncbi:hypothetical protein TWF102_011566 [Orbilia oligospora]|uniref:Uncharacterized protein n=1 Tax=Orbilia oligospora TaxID=2813651 RepID=A0A7C8MY51_ORBOL|nr:hypothetical protein TWF102_011566 [Orbilia oligospora]KAF3094603.1 hypothetical protein TWF706_008439 [Orbilia oligospora]KAF3096496.1 hypothetical protein TWF103_009831 [Orbilia oligospora]KAF3136045.1 hypothetical protein TWF594_008017 [Orbilia oligospora]